MVGELREREIVLWWMWKEILVRWSRFAHAAAHARVLLISEIGQVSAANEYMGTSTSSLFSTTGTASYPSNGNPKCDYTT